MLISLLLLFAGALAGRCPFPDVYNPYDGNCYSVVHLSASWTPALAVCKLVGGEIVTPTSSFEDSTFSQYFQDLNVDWTWLGARVTIFNEVFNTDGKLLSYNKWAPGQPNRKQGDCVKMSSDGYWYSEDCGKSLRFFCKYQPNTVRPSTAVPTEEETHTTDSPATVVPVRTEAAELPTTQKEDSVTSTSVPSGRTSEPETPAQKTTETPTGITADPDTDSPTTEKAVTDCSQKSCPRGFTFNPETCACYLLTYSTMNWNQAENYCRKQNAHLTSIHSRDEAKFITNLVTLPGHLIHVGLQYQSKKGWTWSDGSINDYNDFAPHQPIGSLTISGCGALYGNGYFYSSYLTNQPCSSFYLHAVCKMPLL